MEIVRQLDSDAFGAAAIEPTEKQENATGVTLGQPRMALYKHMFTRAVLALHASTSPPPRPFHAPAFDSALCPTIGYFGQPPNRAAGRLSLLRTIIEIPS
jgi:hypothetical protein